MEIQFNLEHQYQLYLKRVNLKENEMQPIQRNQLRQTFIGACGQMLILLRDELSEFEEDKAIVIMQNMLNQVSDYFLKENNKIN
jgi:hypothetical protein